MSRVKIDVIEGAAKFWPEGGGVLGFRKPDEIRTEGDGVLWNIAPGDLVEAAGVPVPPDDMRARGAIGEWLSANAEKIADAVKRVGDLLEKLAAADMAAPAVGSASVPFKPRAGAVSVACLEGVAVLRVYHDTNKSAGFTGADARDMGVDAYQTRDGAPTSKAWSTTVLFPGQVETFEMIEGNAISLAIYG